MSTAGERLVALSGLSGVAASVHLLAIGAGATTGDALVDYSGLPTGSASDHLMADSATAAQDFIVFARRLCRR